MALKEKISNDLKEAMKAGDAQKRDTLRLLDSAIKNVEIEKQKRETGLSDEEIVEIVGRLVKQRNESIRQFTEGNRADLVDKERAELDIIKEYLPEQLGEEDLQKIVADVISKSGASSAADLGRVMGAVMGEVKGKADGNAVRAITMRLLNEKSQ